MLYNNVRSSAVAILTSTVFKPMWDSESIEEVAHGTGDGVVSKHLIQAHRAQLDVRLCLVAHASASAAAEDMIFGSVKGMHA
jgi:hypothetical protein